ncbi:S8 family serine peptidase [Trueperella pyogenes]|uniref:S8 family serine peptidase n=1 Tax=Trueperella pyogenes TaxID=1661 RepID=UPI003132F987
MHTRSKRFLATFILWILVAIGFVSIPNAVATTNIDEEISGSDDQSWHSVIVVMEDQQNTDGSPATTNDEKIEHVEKLIDTAKDSQHKVLDKLTAEESKDHARDVEPLYVVNAVSATVTKEVAVSLAKTPGVAEVKVNRKIEADPVVEDSAITLSTLADESSPKHVPWNLRQIGISEELQNKYNGQGITVGIIDSGVDVSHPALKDKWRGNTGDKAVSWLDTVGDSPVPVDSTGHGTHVIGTVLGTDPSGKSLLGVAPQANYIAARVFDEHGDTDNGRLLKAMEWMLAPVDSSGVRHPELAPRIVNNSWGTSATDSLLQNALKQWRKAGILPIFSAGNVGENTPGGEGSITQPASFPETFAVGALRNDDVVAKFSLRGPSKFTDKPKPDIAAPGVNIRSSYLNHRLKILSGTSMAAPQVTGVAALVLSANPALKLEQLEEILRKSATSLTDNTHVNSPNHAYGAGKVNAGLAIDMALPNTEVGSVIGNVYVRGSDTDAPVIDHSAVRVFYKATTTNLSAHVADDSGVQDVILKIKGKSENTRTESMVLVEGNKLDGKYEFVISPKNLEEDDNSYQICATDRTKKESCTVENPFEQKAAVTVGWKENFENGTDGFEISGETPMWMWGKPGDSLPKAASGEKVVGVGLEGKGYEGLVESVLLTPPIALKTTDKAALTFNHWYNLDNYSYATYDSAEVWVGEVTGDTGTVNWEAKPQRYYTNKNATWEKEHLDLSAYAGKTIRIMFGVRGAWKSAKESGGWILDDMEIVADTSDKLPETIDNDLTIDKFADGRTKISFLPLKDKTVSSYRLYRAHDSGTFDMVKELTGTEIQKYTINFADYPTPQTGTYTYYVTAVAGGNESKPSKLLQRTFTKGEAITSYNFEAGDQGWTSDTSTERFERGIPSLSDEKNTGKAPTSKQQAGKNPNSPNVFATVLNDYRKPNATYTLMSPKIDLSSYQEVTLYWQQWFNTRGRKGSDEWDTYDDDIASIEARADDGQWKTIFTLDDKKIEEVDPVDKRTQLRTLNAWHVDSVTLPADVLSKTTQVRFVLKSGKEQYDFASGWYIDDVMFVNAAGATIPQPQPSDASASLTVYGGEDIALPNLTTVASVSHLVAADDSGASDSWVPAHNATVELVDRGAKVTTEMGTGAYLLRGRTGTVTVLAQAYGYKPQSAVVEIQNGQITKDFYLEKASLQEVTFAVLDKSGKPITDAVLTIYESEETKPVATLHMSEASTAQLLPGNYLMRADASGYRATSLPFTVKDEGKNEVSIELAATRKEGDPRWQAYDSGHSDSALVNMAAGKTAAVKFDADEGDHVTAARFFVYKASTAQDFEWAIWDTDNIDGLPGRMLIGPRKAHVEAGSGGAWVEIKMPYPIAVKDSYYVSYTQITDTNGIALGIDSSVDGTDRSFKLINAAWGSPDEKGQFMINAEVTHFAAIAPTPGEEENPEKEPGTPGDILHPTPDPTPDQKNPDKADSTDGQGVIADSSVKPTPDQPSGNSQAVQPTGTATTLPFTGASTLVLLVVALVMVSLGIVTLGVRKSRR